MGMRFILILSVLGFMLSCNSSKKTDEKTLFVSAETRTCQAGVLEKQCLQVKYTKDQSDWELFYDDIDGFKYEAGYDYELIVKVEDVKNPAADASSLKYTLVKEVSKIKKQ